MSKRIRVRLVRELLIVFILVGPLSVMTSRSEEEEDVWRAYRTLAGVWKGEGSGFGNVSDVTHEWNFVLNGKFLRLQTRSVERKPGGSGEIHEDVGFVSRDTDRGNFVFRQFLSEGYVNTYDLSVKEGENREILFGYRDIESSGGLRAKMRLTFLNENEYEMILDLASPGKDFSTCQQMRMKRVKR